MNVHDDKSLDAELDRLRVAPPPRAALRRDVLEAIAREPRAAAGVARPAAPRESWLETLAALWRELGGTRLAAPAFAMALAVGVGMSWLAEDAVAADDGADDLVALAQLDDAYEGLEP